MEATGKLKQYNRFITCGALSDDQGIIIGPMKVVQFETEDKLILDGKETYITGKAWHNREEQPFLNNQCVIIH